VARQEPGERLAGALLELMDRLRRGLSQQNITLTNEVLEGETALHTLIDGIDATLIDLAADELGEGELVRIAAELSGQTFAARQADPDTMALMREVFELRARRVAGVKTAGRLSWIRETGTRARMLESVESTLLPMRGSWDDIQTPTDPQLVETLLVWAWELPDMKEAIGEAYRGNAPSRSDFAALLCAWLDGQPLVEIAQTVKLEIDILLGVHSKVLSYVLQVSVEHAVALLKRILEARGLGISQSVIDFPEHLRFGVPSRAARVLASGIRHRRAAVTLGRATELATSGADDPDTIFAKARQLIDDQERWLPVLGSLVFQNTVEDLKGATTLDDSGFT
jgi:helicase